MVFSSTVFLLMFLPLTLLGYFVIKENYRNYWLLLISLIFFGWSQPNYLWIIVLNIVINYCAAMFIGISRKFRKLVLVSAVIANILILFYFKYFDFTIESINEILGLSFDLKGIILPIGISFFTFQGMSYVVDVYRNDVSVQKNLFKLALYITLFPQLIAGPIVRYKDVAHEIDYRIVSLDDFSDGVQRFIIGLAKKAIIANTMAVLVDNVWEQGANCNLWSVAWAACIAYTLQIYFDFSGYSDMAIGIGRMFGFHFSENFNLPYIAESISEFWRRWHISLSSWFRDYVYIPLGGNRKYVYLNLAIVFILTGIWHGASWHFLVWGIWNGFFILLERCLSRNGHQSIMKVESQYNIKRMMKKIYTLTVVNLGWILFRAPSTGEAVEFIFSMFGVADKSKMGYTLFWYLDRWTLVVMLAGIFFSTSIPSKIKDYLTKRLDVKVQKSVKYVALLLLLYLTMLRIVSGTYNPFIYFQF